MSLEAGRQLLHYQLVEKIGEGGMGVVWKALDTTLNRDVAIKVLPEGFAAEADRLARFEREAKLLASLSHPNIAGIYGIHKADGNVFLAMELIEGEDLAQRLSRGALAREDALKLALQIAQAFEAAHESGVIHRDLKPANVKLTPDGQIKVLDFGLAKALSTDPSNPGASPSMSPTLTSAGTIAGSLLGTASYMSPEQAKGKEVDRRADIWSFGVVLYEMLTGRRLFEGEGISETLAAVIMKDIDFGGLPGDTPQPIRRLLERCLERDPKSRMRDIGDARIRIEEALRAPAEPPRTAELAAERTGWTRFVPWGIAAAALVALAWIGLTGSVGPEPGPVMRFTMTTSGDQQLDDSPMPMFALSRDGKRIVYLGTQGGQEMLFLRHSHQGEAVLLKGTEDADNPFFSPDGEWIGFESDGKLKKVSALGGPPVTLCDAQYMRGASWGTDGTIVFSPHRSRGLMRVSEAGGEPEVLTDLGAADDLGAPSDRWPQILPGDRWAIYTSTQNNSQYANAEIKAISLKDKSTKTLIENGTFARFLPPGFLVYARENTMFAVRFDPVAAEVKGSPVPVLENVDGAMTYGSRQLAFSDNGTLLYLSGAGNYGLEELVWFHRDGSDERASQHERNFVTATLSPDGRHIALALDTNDTFDLWLLELERDSLTRLTFDETIDQSPVWSPDGEWLAYSSIREGEGNINLHRIRADGTGKAERLATANARQTPFSWSPDGTVLAFTEWDEVSGGDVKLLHADGEVEDFQVSPFMEIAPKFSPDGRWISYVSNMSDEAELYVRPYGSAGKQVKISTAGSRFHAWSPDGKELLYRDPAGALMSVGYRVDGDRFVPESPVKLSDFPSPPYSFIFQPTPDGRILTYKDVGGRESVAAAPIVVINWTRELEERVPQ